MVYNEDIQSAIAKLTFKSGVIYDETKLSIDANKIINDTTDVALIYI